MSLDALALAVLAVALIAVSTFQFISLGVSSGRAAAHARRRRSQDVLGLRQAAEIARLNSELQAAASGSALPWRVLEVSEIIDESRDCRSFYLIDPYGQTLPDFHPGQHLLVRPALASAFPTTRCYSLSNSPDGRVWRITVKRQAVGPPGSRLPHSGGLSTWLHEAIGVGDCLLIGGPTGQFFLPPDNHRPLVLVAAGVGITPMASMLRWSLEHTPQRPLALLYQAKDAEHWPLGQSLHLCQPRMPQGQVQSFFSRSALPQLQHLRHTLPGEFTAGKLTTQHLLRALPGRQCDYFLCGPTTWMDALRSELTAAGIAPEHVHWESFGTAAQTALPASPAGTAALSVRFEHSDVDTQWQDPEQTVWELAREHQVEIPSGCLSGVCGSCRVKLLSGQVVYDREVNIELAANECLSCIARPQTALRIDA